MNLLIVIWALNIALRRLNFLNVLSLFFSFGLNYLGCIILLVLFNDYSLIGLNAYFLALRIPRLLVRLLAVLFSLPLRNFRAIIVIVNGRLFRLFWNAFTRSLRFRTSAASLRCTWLPHLHILFESKSSKVVGRIIAIQIWIRFIISFLNPLEVTMIS